MLTNTVYSILYETKKKKKKNFFWVVPTQLVPLTTCLFYSLWKEEKGILFRVISNSTCSTNKYSLFYSLRKKEKRIFFRIISTCSINSILFATKEREKREFFFEQFPIQLALLTILTNIFYFIRYERKNKGSFFE